jgi:hypothetical protein
MVPRESNNLDRSVPFPSAMLTQGTGINSHDPEGREMQKGSLERRTRLKQPDVWEFRWREPGPDGTRHHHRIVVGSIVDIAEESAARQAVAALQHAFNEHSGSSLQVEDQSLSHEGENPLDAISDLYLRSENANIHSKLVLITHFGVSWIHR